MTMKKMLALLLAVAMLLSMAACAKKDDTTGTSGGGTTTVTLKQATYNTYTSTMPSNWNELTYTDNNDTQILSYIGSSFFNYDYKFANDEKYNADGTINVDAIVEGSYTVYYDAATKLEDVTATVDAKWGYTDEQKAEGGYAYKITLRDDLKWDDGTAITAADFVYSMQQTLDPDFMNYRANTYYDTWRIINAKNYFYSGSASLMDNGANAGYQLSDLTKAEDGTYVTPTGEPVWIAVGYGLEWLSGYGLSAYINAYGEQYFDLTNWEALYAAADEDGLVPLTDEYYGYLVTTITGNAAWGETEADACNYFVYQETFAEMDFSEVGVYAIEEENAIVICMDIAWTLLNEDGSLNYMAAYYFSGMPLVHKEKYEANKIEPEEGATLWTSSYCSTLDSTASWGPYKLTEYVAGSHFTLEINENWYGWNMEEYKNQYNVTKMYVRKIEEQSTQWLAFLSGEVDDGVLSTDNFDEYGNSKYAVFTTTSTGSYGIQLFSDLDTLKESANNNGILAIAEFRQAINLGSNRSDIVEKIWPGSTTPLFGLLSPGYYYDIENSPYLDDGGCYRNSTLAKEGILRAYGYTQGDDGKWSSGSLTGLTTDEAYETLTGYNLTLAREKMQQAIDILLADPEYYGYDSTKDITLVYGSSVDSDTQRFRCTYFQEQIIDPLIEGTVLEGKIKVVFDASAGSSWSSAFRTGLTQIGFGYGMSGAAFDPFNMIVNYTDCEESLNYHQYFDTNEVDLTLTLPAGDYEGAGETITMSVRNWSLCLMGTAADENQPYQYNWNNGFAPTEARLTILAALEEWTLTQSRTIMIISSSGGSLLGAKFSYMCTDENVFMGFGGLRYMVVNYTDAEWSEFVAANNNDLSSEYKKSE